MSGSYTVYVVLLSIRAYLMNTPPTNAEYEWQYVRNACRATCSHAFPFQKGRNPEGCLGVEKGKFRV